MNDKELKMALRNIDDTVGVKQMLGVNISPTLQKQVPGYLNGIISESNPKYKRITDTLNQKPKRDYIDPPTSIAGVRG